MSEAIFERSRQLDIMGISVLMGGAGPAMVHFGLFGNPDLQYYYFAATVLVWVAVALVIASKGTEGIPIPSRIRVLMCLALPGLAAVIHGIILSTTDGSFRVLKLEWIIWTLLLNVAGAVFYTSRVGRSTLSHDLLVETH